MAAGRPTKYSDEIRQRALDYIKGGYIAEGDAIPSIAGLSVSLGVNRSSLYQWRDTKPEFSDILNDLIARQERVLLSNGLTGEFNSQITKLVLGKHGYKESKETDLTSSDGSMKPTVIEIVGVESSDD